MGSAPIVILLVGMVFPIALLLLALVADLIAVIWAAYTLWREDWSVSLWRAIRRIGHAPHWRAIHHH